AAVSLTHLAVRITPLARCRSHDLEIRIRYRGMRVEHRELDRCNAADAISVVKHAASGGVVDDPIIGIVRRISARTREEGITRQRPGRRQRCEDCVLEQHRVIHWCEIDDMIDVESRVEGGVELDPVYARTAIERVVASTTAEHVVTSAAIERV